MERVDYCLLFVVVAMVFVCPFNKVEESFNTQAVHDLLEWKTELSKVDQSFLLYSSLIPSVRSMII